MNHKSGDNKISLKSIFLKTCNKIISRVKLKKSYLGILILSLYSYLSVTPEYITNNSDIFSNYESQFSI